MAVESLRLRFAPSTEDETRLRFAGAVFSKHEKLKIKAHCEPPILISDGLSAPLAPE